MQNRILNLTNPAYYHPERAELDLSGQEIGSNYIFAPFPYYPMPHTDLKLIFMRSFPQIFSC